MELPLHRLDVRVDPLLRYLAINHPIDSQLRNPYRSVGRGISHVGTQVRPGRCKPNGNLVAFENHIFDFLRPIRKRTSMRKDNPFNPLVTVNDPTREITNKVVAVNLWNEIDITTAPEFGVLSGDYANGLFS